MCKEGTALQVKGKVPGPGIEPVTFRCVMARQAHTPKKAGKAATAPRHRQQQPAICQRARSALDSLLGA
jgi:hypothetical protein